MAIDTNNEKLAVMEWDSIFEPALPLLPGTSFNQGDKQQLLWGYPGINWGPVSIEVDVAVSQGLSQGFTVYVN